MGGFYRFIRGLMIVLSKTLFPCKVYGKENIPETGGFVLCSNHTSMSDVIFIIASNKRQVHFMGKAEIFDNKIMAFLYGKMGVFPVKRGAHDTSAVKYAEDLGKEGKIVGIFPEGTRSKDGTIGRVKSGIALIASEANAPVLPVCIRYRGKRDIDVNIGRLIPSEDVHIDEEDRKSMRKVSNRIHDELVALQQEIIDNDR